MGFDPRHWTDRTHQPRGDRVTSNVDALLAENDALRREVQRLTKELEQLRWRERSSFRQGPAQQPRWREASAQAPPRIRRDQVQAWAESLAQQPGWSTLRSSGLELLIDRLNRSGFPSQLTLQQRLDRLVSGLGTDLIAAVGDNPETPTMAVLAAFALYGVRASEWLDEDPGRVVLELRRRQEQSRSSSGGRRTRTDQRSTDRSGPTQQTDSRAAAFAVLELVPEASAEAIKQAHRRLVKLHHPDMGGSADAFRRINEAYQLLVG